MLFYSSPLVSLLTVEDQVIKEGIRWSQFSNLIISMKFEKGTVYVLKIERKFLTFIYSSAGLQFSAKLRTTIIFTLKGYMIKYFS